MPRRSLRALLALLALAAPLAAQRAPATAAAPGFPGAAWPTATPAAAGMNAAVLDSIDREIAEGRYGHVDRFLVVRAGRAVLDRRYARDWDAIYGDSARRRNGLVLHDQTGAYNYFNPWWHPTWRRGDLHSLQSVTKTITSILIGVAAARGEFPSLDTPVLRFFDTTAVKEIDDRKRRMTIRHLLTMTGGFDWNENLPYIDPRNSTIAMEGSYDWVSFTIDRPMAREPGTAFNYNSGETVLLAHIFRVATGADIEEYAARHLFTPLGITRWFWKRTPAGLVDTEGGLYLEAADLARIWYLFLRNGRWEGRQVVTEQWVRESVTPAVATGPNRNNAWYGYKWWLHRDPTDSTRWVWAGSGFGGQLPYVFPELDLVVVFNGWNILPGGRGIPQRAMLERLARAVVVPAAPQRSPGR